MNSLKRCALDFPYDKMDLYFLLLTADRREGMHPKGDMLLE
jgi:hypothetical protein